MTCLEAGREIEYDHLGRMKYHPDYHFNHGHPFSEEDIMYLCKFWETVNVKELSLGLGRTEMTLASLITRLKRDDRYDEYIKKYDEEMRVVKDEKSIR